MVKFSQDFLDSLEPRDQAFDIKEDRDFAMRVFPNGSKTWVYIHKVDQCVQRRTLGIYPQMGIEQAHEALRQAREKAGAKGAKGVQKGTKAVRRRQRRVKPPVRKSPPKLSGKLSVAVAAGCLGIGALVILQAVKDLQLPTADSPKTSGFVKETAPVAAAYSPEKVAAPQPDPVSVLPGDRAAAKEQIATLKIPTTVLKPQKAPKHASRQAPSIVAPTVKRAQFTHGIEDREPIDRISRTLPAWDYKQGPRPIYFFTEVSGLGGRTIYHRWERNGRVVSEIPFDVKSSWRWRVFSSKNILPTMAGRWRVTVVDDLDNVLYRQDITLSPMRLMSASNAAEETPHLGGAR